jgi:hypothetical protein
MRTLARIWASASFMNVRCVIAYERPLYQVLVTVADAQGLSYYGEASLERLLSMPAPRLAAARAALIQHQVQAERIDAATFKVSVAYQPLIDPTELRRHPAQPLRSQHPLSPASLTFLAKMS